MASVIFGGKPVNTNGELPKVGSKAPDFKLTTTDLSIVTLADFPPNITEAINVVF